MNLEKGGRLDELKEKFLNRRNALIVLAMMGAMHAKIDGVRVSDMFEIPSAITTPLGPVYFKRDPSDKLIAHEACHFDRLQKIGAPQFYWDYVSGGACLEESRCGQTKHSACRNLPYQRAYWPSSDESDDPRALVQVPQIDSDLSMTYGPFTPSQEYLIWSADHHPPMPLVAPLLDPIASPDLTHPTADPIEQ